MAYKFLPQNRKIKKQGLLTRAGRLENFLKKNKRDGGGTLIRDSRVSVDQLVIQPRLAASISPAEAMFCLRKAKY